MEEITFVDILTHYEIKLKEISDEIETIKNQIRKTEGTIEASWRGMAAEACQLKLQTINKEISKSLSEISEALVNLSVIKEIVAEESTNDLNVI